MASKYQRITALYESTIKQATNSPDAWTAFLQSACRNYKCRFDEQILIYAQRPDATAVLEIEKWNKQFGRWVNGGAKGIAVFDDEHSDEYKLKHYFDISDTHETRFTRAVPIWQMEQDYEAEVIESLENSFGDLADTSTLTAALISAANNAVEDNLADYLRDLKYSMDGSFLGDLDDFNVELEYTEMIQNSVAYMLLTRCGLDAREHLDEDSFRFVRDFNTRETVNAIGLATSDIAEMCLREIAATALNLQKNKNRTVANRRDLGDNINKNREGGLEHGRNVDISDGGRLPRAESDRAGGRADNPWQVRVGKKEIPATEPQNPISESVDGGNAERAFDGNRTDGTGAHGVDNRTYGGGAGRGRADESVQPDEVGGLDEQHTAQRGGDDTQRTGIRIKPLPTQQQQLSLLGEAEETATAESPAFSISQQIIDEVLTSGGNELDSALRIVSYFKKDHTVYDNSVFLRDEYRTGGKGFIFGGQHVSVWFDNAGLQIAVGDTTRTAAATVVTWAQAAERIGELLGLGRYMPQSELDKADGVEIKKLAENLWEIHRDRADGVEFPFLPDDLFTGGFPDSTARIAEFLVASENRTAILDGLNDFARDYANDSDLLRFPMAARYLRNAITTLSDLRREPLIFTADETVSTARPAFITQDEIDRVLCGSGDVRDGKYGIYTYFMSEHTAKEKVDFLKDAYGIGGYGRTGFDEWHDGKGIAYSRENGHMPYDKVILPWNKVARRIDELIADGRYLNERQTAHIPEYEKVELSREIHNFYPRQPEDLPRPFPRDMDFWQAVNEVIRPQLDDPERVAEILSQMSAILDNTADFDRNYENMRRAFDHLTAYQNGEYTLFPTDKPTRPAPPKAVEAAPPVRPVDESAEYDLTLGATVYLGVEEFELNAFDDTHVVLRDMNMPLITLEMPRDEFDRKLRENPLNDGLIKTDDPIDAPRVLYRKYLPKLVAEIMQDGEMAAFLRDTDTDVSDAEDAIRDYLVEVANSGDYPGLADAFEIPQFTEWMVEDILDRTYQDVSVDGRDSVIRNESESDTPDWAKRPTLTEQVREELSLRGYAVSDELIEDGIGEFSSYGDYQDIADRIESEYLTEEPEPYTPKRGDRYEIQGRQFVVDRVELDFDEVSLRDITFEGNTGFPIFRKESLDFIRMYDPIQPVDNGQVTVDSYDAPKPGNTELSTVNSQLSTELTPAWEKATPCTRGNTFDPHPEIPMSERYNYRITDIDLGAGGAKTKYKNNVEAIKTLQRIEAENRFATPEEQEILARYVGWGGIQNAFDADKPDWANEYAELKGLLTDEEYKSARSTTLTAHYTSPTVISAIYKAVENMGFKTGNVLEPSCGIGNFFGLVPESMSGSKMFGVELDSLTGRIARQLYQKNSIAIQGFEKTELPDSFFDLAIGNVPFGSYKVPDKRYDKYGFNIHEYFFARTLDKVRPGGVVAFVTSMFTMDKQNSSVRKYLAQRADFLGAIRLPNTAFKANAGTEVTTDIIFLQKRDRVIDIEPEWVHLGQTEDGLPINAYFAENPEMVLGTMSNESGNRMYGAANSISCLPFEDTDLSEQLDEAITNIHAEIPEYERGEDDIAAFGGGKEDNSIPADPGVRNYSYTLVDGQIYYRQDSRMVHVELSLTAQNRVKGMIALRECVRDLIMYQTENYPDHAIEAEQKKLNRLYDSFTKKYGLINSRGNSMAFSPDSAYCLLCSLEVIDENGELERKAAMFDKRTINPQIPITHVDTASEALAVSLSEKARVDLAYMSDLTGMSEDALAKELEGVIFLNIGNAADQSKTYVTADEYLSGNVREKLASAVAAQMTFPDGRYDANVTALTAAIPQDLTAAEISVRLGATWIPPEDIERFMYELLQTSGWARGQIHVNYFHRTGEWNITNKTQDRTNIHVFNTYGTQRVNAYKIIEDSLNLRDVRVFDKVTDGNGDEKRVLNKKETAIAQAKQDIIRSKFEEWIWADPARRERLCRLYNDKFNSIRPRQYDGSHLKFVGMNPEITLRKHQVDAIAHILYGGNTLLAHEVGAGKTYEMVAAAMESKRIGICNKSLFVVPNHITEQWAAEFLQLYPSANILVATKRDFETKNRKKFCARIATGDYDAIIIGHSQFERIPMSIERQRDMLQDQIDELVVAIAEAKREKGEKYSIKQMERLRKSLEVKMEKLLDQGKKDDVVTFEELGIDRLFIDEAHYYKNLFLVTKMRNVGGIAQVEAQKSSDLFMKCRYLDEQQKNGRCTVFATGTPISNSMVELYTMQRYLQYGELVKQGLQHFDSWASTFGETVTAIELAPEGTGYRSKTRFAKFYNLPELMSVFRMVADIQTADMLNLPVPEAEFHTEVIKPSEWQQEMVAELAERAEKIRGGDVDPHIDNMLRVTNDGRKLALDQRLINPLLPDDPNGKVAACANNVFGIWEETKANKSAQLIFSDLSTPKADGQRDAAPNSASPTAFTDVYNDLKQKLIAKGIPAEEIAFIHDADSEAKKKELFAKVRKGQIRVLMGSTQKMGAGTNVQDRLIALHDLDCPWRPSDLAQRLGRIVRQGNKNPIVKIFRYVTEGTFDSYLYQLVENKQKFIAQIMTSKLPVRMAEDIDDTALSYAEIKALATGNPLIIEKAQLESDVNKLKILHASHLSQKYALEDKILKEYPKEIKRLTERIDGYKADIETVGKHPASKDHFPPMTVGGKIYAEKADAGKAIIEVCKAMTSPDPVPLGEYRGFQMVLAFDAFSKEYRVTLSGALSHTVALGTDIHGNITRLDNKLEGFAESLTNCEGQLDEVKKQLEAAKGEVDRPFKQEDEFKEKSARLKEVDTLLNMDEKSHELLGGEPDEGDAEQSERKSTDRER